MAYADGELGGEDRTQFEERLRAEPALAIEVSEYRALQLLAREMAPPEPMDHEWRRIEADPTNQGIHLAGWTLFVGGAVGLAGWGIWGIATDDGPPLPRVLSIAAIGGLLTLLLGTVRNRLRTLPLDPYRKIQR